MRLARLPVPTAPFDDDFSPSMAEFMDATVHQVAQIVVDLALCRVPPHPSDRGQTTVEDPRQTILLAQAIARAVLARLLEESRG